MNKSTFTAILTAILTAPCVIASDFKATEGD